MLQVDVVATSQAVGATSAHTGEVNTGNRIQKFVVK